MPETETEGISYIVAIFRHIVGTFLHWNKKNKCGPDTDLIKQIETHYRTWALGTDIEREWIPIWINK